ncbi:tetratricopeptide repeat protein [Streptomyces zaomyceticus]|uniref:tetratricopeptide repeat protein n=1 Tax=Streptomyces zaomyceticus TaxID=68286 RepID=UPI0037B3BE2E
MDGRADQNGRVYQASGDQHIVEHHHHGDVGPGAWAGTESVRQPTGGRAPLALRDRIELMRTLQAAVAPGAGNQVYVLHGMGGCGKTAVARSLFQFATAERDRIGFWVNAADRASLRSGMLAVAADRGATEGQLNAARNGLRAPADLVWERLEASESPWLLVLDNADSPEVLQDGGWLRANPRGTVLVTTRRAAAQWWPHAELHHVGVLPREAAAQVLCDLAPNSGTLEEAAEIADRLGRLPLALTLAGGFLSHQVIDPWSMEKYGKHLEGQERVGLIDRGAAALAQRDDRHLIRRTWQLSLDALAAQGLQESAPLLRLLACFGPDPLPLALLNTQEINSVVPQTRAEMALHGLLDQSLTALVDVGVRCVQTHAVLLASVMAGMPHDQAADLTSAAAQILSAVVPAIPERGPRDLRISLLAPHVLALLHHAFDVSVAAKALDVAVRLTCALHRSGDYLSAWELASAAAAITEPKLGPEHHLVLSAHARSGRALFRLGRFEESEAILRRVLTDRERLLGIDHPDTLDSYFGINHPLQQLGRATEGLELLQRAIDGREQVLGRGHPLTFRSRGIRLEYLPLADLAVEVDGATMKLPQECASHLGPNHVVTRGVRLSYTNALFRLGRFQEAVGDAGRLAAEYESHYGPHFSITHSAQSLYALILAGIGDADSAAELMTVTAERRALALGAEHPYTVETYQQLAEIRAAMGGHP